MRRFRLIGLAFVAMLTLGAALSASAFALPEFLPFSAGTKTFTSALDSGEAILENSASTKIKCTALKGEGTLETDTLGTFKISFENCTLSGTPCTGTGDLSRTILLEGSFHYVDTTLGTGETLGMGMLFLPKLAEFDCVGGLVNNLLKGTLICLILTPLTSSVTHLFHCLPGATPGSSLYKQYWNDAGTHVEVQLLASLNEGGFKEANVQALATLTTTADGSWMNE
jgi:hypothetical protein